VRHLPDGTVETVGDAVASIDDRFRLPVTLRTKSGGSDPLWHLATARLGADFSVKFAWSAPAAERLAREIDIMRALDAANDVPCRPGIAAVSEQPLLLITHRVPGCSLFEAAPMLDVTSAAPQIAAYLARLHAAPLRVGPVESLDVGYPVSTATVRSELPDWVPDELQAPTRAWCDWIDETLREPLRRVVTHGDLNGDNQVWQYGRLRVVIDYETVALAEPEYDFRGLAGIGPGAALLTATLTDYSRRTGRPVSPHRVLAWHVRGALDDILWRSKAGVALPDERVPTQWFADFAELRECLNP
jgi:aminoglycoside phosphotransferase (APT) family kinase protein